jgi:large subunit ribosomal protein LP2
LHCCNLSAVGVEADGEKLKQLMGEVSGKDLSALIEEGKKKLASLPAAGPAVAAPAGGAPAAGAAPAAKKEEKKEESPEEDMGFSLFD